MADQDQYFVLNGTSGNLYPISRTCRDIVLSSNKMATVFAVYDICKDEVWRYKDLTVAEDKKKKKQEKFDARGEGDAPVQDISYWNIDGAEVKSVVAAESILAEAILERLQTAGTNGIISFPESWTDFTEGKFQHAMGAISFKIKWVSF